MPNKLIYQKEVDIYQFPTVQEESQGGEITIGDLHGNAIKLLFILIKHGIIANINSRSYQMFVNVYCMAFDLELFLSYSYRCLKNQLKSGNTGRPIEELQKEKATIILKTFNWMLEGLKFHSHLTVRLLGDELADRGNNDYFTLKILEKLVKSRVPVEIILSNHSMEFIASYERKGQFIPRVMTNETKEVWTRSMQNMQSFIDAGLIQGEEIMSLIEHTYKPLLKALSYSLNEQNKEITIYSHAPIDLKIIQQLANKAGVAYKDGTYQALAETIDRINAEFQKHVQKNTVTIATYNTESLEMEKAFCMFSEKKSGEGIKADGKDPAYLIAWNRDYKILNRDPQHPGHPAYNIIFTNGHDSNDPEKKNPHIFNLDNVLGKGLEFNQGEYTVLYTDIDIAPKSEPTSVGIGNFFSKTATSAAPCLNEFAPLSDVAKCTNG